MPTKEDLWLRLFNSEFFDEWLALSYIHQKPAGGVHEYLCNRLFELSDEAVGGILSQLCELAVRSQPSPSVQRTLVGLSARSTRTALKVYWLLRTMSRDQRGASKTIQSLLQQVEDAAQRHAHLSHTPALRRTHDGAIAGANRSEAVLCSKEAADDPGTATLGNAASSTLEPSLAGYTPSTARRPRSAVECDRLSTLSSQLGKGEGVTQLVQASMDDLSSGGTGLLSRSPPNEPPLEGSGPLTPVSARRFRATVAFLDILCECSAALVPTAPLRRMSALRQQLEDINARLLDPDLHAQVIWPMGDADHRVARLVPDRAAILNSRERAPFLLFVELLPFSADVSTAQAQGTVMDPAGVATDNLALGVLRSDNCVGSERSGPRPGALWEHGVAMAIPSQMECSMPSTGSLRADAWLKEADTGRTVSGAPLALAELLEGSDALQAATGPPGSQAPRRPASADAPAAQAGEDMVARVPSEEALERMIMSMHVTHLREPAARGLRMSVHGLTPCVGTHSPERAASGGPKGVPSCSHGAPGGFSRLLRRVSSADSLGLAGGCADPAVRTSASGQPRPHSGRQGVPPPRDTGDIDGAVSSSSPSPEPPVAPTQTCSTVSARQTVSHASQDGSTSSWVNVDPLSEARGASSQPAESPVPHEPVTCGPTPGKAAARVTVPPAAAAAVATVEQGLAAMTRAEYVQHVHGAALEEVLQRIQATSPYGSLPGWRCQAIIVKSGDDCRQELLAMQLILMFRAIFEAEHVPLWLYPYEVLPTSHRTALIELIPNCMAIHSVKRSLSPGTSLADHFFRMFPPNTAECEVAQKEFARSLAGYSLVCYLLQIKDRHNANILLDLEGHIIHIDFGFMLSNSPGGVHFERAPFKLTAEYMHIMESDIRGRPSSCFDYFQSLWSAGYEAAAKHSEKIIKLVEMMQHSGCPCFAGGKRSLDALRKRFRLDHVACQALVADSIDAWTTRQYDLYQRASNGIL